MNLTKINFISLFFFFFLVFTLSFNFVSADSVGTFDMTEGKVVYTTPPFINYSIIATNTSNYWGSHLYTDYDLLVPYTGATADVDIAGKNFIGTYFLASGGFRGTFLYGTAWDSLMIMGRHNQEGVWRNYLGPYVLNDPTKPIDMGMRSKLGEYNATFRDLHLARALRAGNFLINSTGVFFYNNATDKDEPVWSVGSPFIFQRDVEFGNHSFNGSGNFTTTGTGTFEDGIVVQDKKGIHNLGDDMRFTVTLPAEEAILRMLNWDSAWTDNKRTGFFQLGAEQPGYTFYGIFSGYIGEIFTRFGITSYHTTISSDSAANLRAAPGLLYVVQRAARDQEVARFEDENGNVVVIDKDAQVGIGTATPTHKLNVVGDVNITGTSYFGNIIINADNITVNNIISKDGNISFWNSTNSEIVRFLDNGKVGIGTTTPSGKIHIVDGGVNIATYDNTDGGIFATYDDNKSIGLSSSDIGSYGGGGAMGLKVMGGNGVTNDGFIRIYSGGATKVHFDGDGSVGIGTNAPNSTFHIKANTPGTVGSHPAGQLIIQDPDDTVFGNAVITGYESDGAGNPDQQLWYLGSSSGGNTDITFLNRRNANLYLGTNGVSRLTILGNGNVGIGTDTPSERLDLDDGNLTTTGIGSFNVVNSEFLTFRNDEINQEVTNSNSAAIMINYRGYLGGTTAFRNLWIGDGKNNNIMVVDGSDGRVGIGDVNPETKLDVDDGNVSFDNGQFFFDYNNNRVGIGTTTPTHKLNVVGDANITGIIINDAIYCESSELTDQIFPTAGVRYRLNISNVDEGNGITMEAGGNNGTNITIDTSGVYHMVAQPQVKAGAGDAGDFHMWIEKFSGGSWADISDSNIELKLSSLEEDVIVLATTLKLNQGEKLRLVVSVSDNGILLHAQSPAGEPIIPSIIFTMYRVGN